MVGGESNSGRVTQSNSLTLTGFGTLSAFDFCTSVCVIQNEEIACVPQTIDQVLLPVNCWISLINGLLKHQQIIRLKSEECKIHRYFLAPESLSCNPFTLAGVRITLTVVWSPDQPHSFTFRNNVTFIYGRRAFT